MQAFLLITTHVLRLGLDKITKNAIVYKQKNFRENIYFFAHGRIKYKFGSQRKRYGICKHVLNM